MASQDVQGVSAADAQELGPSTMTSTSRQGDILQMSISRNSQSHSSMTLVPSSRHLNGPQTGFDTFTPFKRLPPGELLAVFSEHWLLVFRIEG